jgi:ligand-binding SRPBCC domain-containing protein
MQNLEFRQFLPVPVSDAWNFFSNPANLCRITPPEMNFIIRSKLPDKVYPGLIIIYTVSPLFHIPLNWVTEITQVNEPFYFVDEQRTGPYSIWHHEHHFEAVNGGVMMTDKLFYKAPFGFIGELADRMIILRKVRGIFDYRAKVLSAMPEFIRGF